MQNSFISVFGSSGGGTDATKLPLTGGTLTGDLAVGASGSVLYTNGNAGFNAISLNLVQGTSGGANSMSIGGTGGTNIIGPILTTVNFNGLSLTGSQATNTLDIATTWNTTGNPALIYGRATNTLSGATARLIDVGTVAGGSLFNVSKAGVTSSALGFLGTSSGATNPAFGAAINTDFGIYFESLRMMIRESSTPIAGFGDLASGIGLIMTGSKAIGWAATTPDGSYDIQLNRIAAGNLGLGVPLVSGWLNQILTAAGGRIGTDTNNSPTNTLTIAGSVSTGTGTGGNLQLGVYGTNGTSGSAIGTLNTVLTVVAARKVINISNIPTSSAGLSSGDVYSNAGILTIVP